MPRVTNNCEVPAIAPRSNLQRKEILQEMERIKVEELKSQTVKLKGPRIIKSRGGAESVHEQSRAKESANSNPFNRDSVSPSIYLTRAALIKLKESIQQSKGITGSKGSGLPFGSPFKQEESSLQFNFQGLDTMSNVARQTHLQPLKPVGASTMKSGVLSEATQATNGPKGADHSTERVGNFYTLCQIEAMHKNIRYNGCVFGKFRYLMAEDFDDIENDNWNDEEQVLAYGEPPTFIQENNASEPLAGDELEIIEDADEENVGESQSNLQLAESPTLRLLCGRRGKAESPHRRILGYGPNILTCPLECPKDEKLEDMVVLLGPET